MGEPRDGRFSTSLLSLQLQLQTLMEDVGGEHALKLLDTLTELSKSEQKVMLGVFTRVTQRFSRGTLRLESPDDRKLKDLEDSLFDDIMLAMRAASRTNTNVKALPERLQIVDGGGQIATSSRRQSSPINLEDARRTRRARNGLTRSGRVLN